MNSMRRVVLGLVALSLICKSAAAQYCVGTQPFSRTSLQFSAGVALDDLGQLYGVDLRHGFSSMFVSAEATVRTWDVPDFGASQELGVRVGRSFALSAESRLSLCPLLSFTKVFGPNQANGGAWRYADQRFAASLSAGYVLKQTAELDFVATSAIVVGTADPSMTTRFGGNLATFGSFCCARQTFSSVALGLGLSLGRAMTVLPAISFPLDDVRGTTYSGRIVIALVK